MLRHFDKTAGAVVVQAREEARLLGATRLDAEHLLLALSRRTAGDTGRILAGAGLDHQDVLNALDAEVTRSLEAVGVRVAVADRPAPTTGPPLWGTSAKRALQRAVEVVKMRGDRSIRPTHLLLGVLGAAEGTVPRALSAAGVDTPALVASAEAALGEPR